jgi:AbrB family looped-hinge helix DNA binding protein
MPIARSKVTAQGQISVPLGVRQKLGVSPGSILEWDEEGGNIIVRRAGMSPPKTFTERSSAAANQKNEPSRKWKRGSPNIFAIGMRAIDTNVVVRLVVRDDPVFQTGFLNCPG